ncbi:MAG: aminodeoxychorismate/anthranilate synthase component II [Thermoplasmata archaeon]|nr:aminodeoxychorismate/anthranilate synthase component II [Thermoplasmata archaeon]
MKVLLVDHEDSFVYNLYQALRLLGARVDCVRYTEPVARSVRADPDAIVFSPGPGHPRDRRVTGHARRLLARWEGERSFLGVCLGHQLIGEFYGGRIDRADAPVHGETVEVEHSEVPLFRRVPRRFRAARYHSLVVRRDGFPRVLSVTASTRRHTIMALDHRTHPTHGVQFHPESYLTPAGPQILRNFLREARR